ncbi:MAG: hypothetical protein K8I30_23325 [Anaerolineae bacterium]|nr:hypothetical protein [Anaerolineae bacterium]
MSLSIFYTANIRGDLALLPPLFTFLKSLRNDLARFAPEDEDEVMLCMVQPPPARILLLDLGDSCAAEVWHCAATGGRSTLVALNAMGYHAANVSGILSPESRARLAENMMEMALVDVDYPWEDQGVVLSIFPPSLRPSADTLAGLSKLHISLTADTTTRLVGHLLYLARVEAGQIGTAYIGGTDSEPQLLADAIFDLPANTPPDPTISGTVDFVTSEARFFAKRQGG